MQTSNTLTEKITHNKKVFIASGVLLAALSLGAVPAANALIGPDNSDVGAGLSATGEDGEQATVGARAATQDNLDDVGVGTAAVVQDSDGNSASLGTKVESTDGLDNNSADINANGRSQDGDQAGVNSNVKSNDNSADAHSSVMASDEDGNGVDAHLRFGLED